MKNNQNVLIIAGVALAGLLVFALWMMFSSQPAVPATNTQGESETVLEKKLAATPSPDTQLEEQAEVSTSTELKSIESDLNNTVIIEEDFSDLQGE